MDHDQWTSPLGLHSISMDSFLFLSAKNMGSLADDLLLSWPLCEVALRATSHDGRLGERLSLKISIFLA
jgi:hypothetical protein